MLSPSGRHCFLIARRREERAVALAVLPFVGLNVEVSALASNTLELAELSKRGKEAAFALSD